MRLALLVSLALVAGCATAPAADPPASDALHAAASTPHEWTLDEERQLLRFAMNAHLEHQHHDAAHLIEHGLHARELAASGREDEEALHVRRTAPKQEMLRRQLRRAAEIYVDAGKHDLAHRIAALSDDLWEDPLAGTEQPRREQSGNDREIAVVKERIEVLLWAAQIWSEHERPKLVDQLENAIVVRRHAIEGRRDPEAMEARKHDPDRGTLAEILHGAGRLYDEKGWETRAKACFELSEVYGEQWRRQKERAGEREREPERERARGNESDERWRRMAQALERFMERTERLEVKVRKLAERIEELEAEKR